MKKFHFLIVFSFITGIILSGCNTNTPSTTSLSQNSQSLSLKNEEQSDDSKNVSSSEIDTITWKTYVNDKYHFRLKYPDSFELHEGIALKGTSSEHYSISFSKNGKQAWVTIAPESAENGRPLDAPIKSEQIIKGEKAIQEEWELGEDKKGRLAVYRFIDPINNWKLCDESVYCYHIELFAPRSTDVETVKKIFSTFEFIEK